MYLRKIQETDNAALAKIIRQVSAEFGLTADKGFAVADPILDELYSVYSMPRSAYWVIDSPNGVLGGGGIAALSSEFPHICELQKMYFLPEARNYGFAKQIIANAELAAKEFGYTHCYLETTALLQRAVVLYEVAGFQYLDHRLGHSGHDDCEICMLKKI